MTKSNVALPEIPAALATEPFRRVWEDFLHFRFIQKKRVTPRAAELIFNDLKAWGEKKAIAALHQSIKNGWQGVFEPKMPSAKSSNQLDQDQRVDKQRTAAVLRDRERRDAEKKKRIAVVAKLPRERLEAARNWFASRQPNEVARGAMLRADPLGGGTLTDLIYGELKARGEA